VPEAKLEQTEYGLTAADDGWFVVNVRDAASMTNEYFGFSASAACAPTQRTPRSPLRCRGKAVSIELMADVREKVRREAGEVQAIGTPAVSVRDGYTVVDIPVSLEHGDGTGRIVLDADR
jgi:hypothetical protein